VGFGGGGVIACFEEGKEKGKRRFSELGDPEKGHLSLTRGGKGGWVKKREKRGEKGEPPHNPPPKKKRGATSYS